MKVSILGAGAWGTALGVVLSGNGHEVCLWAHRAEHLREVQQTRRNEAYLPGIALRGEWRFEASIASAVAEADLVILAVPSSAFRAVATHLRKYERAIASV